MHRKETFTGLLTNLFSFTSFSYKIGLIRTLLGRGYKINTSVAKFNDDVKERYYILKKNQHPERLINRVVKSYLDKVHNSNNSTPPKDTSIIYLKPPFLNLPNFAQYKVRMLAKKYCKDLQIRLAFTSFKIEKLIIAKDCAPRSLHSNKVYKFTYAKCNSVYVGETSQHLSTRVHEYLFSDKNSHVYKHLKGSSACREACDEKCFAVLESANTAYKLKIKEALYIIWEEPNLNKQLEHYNISLNI